MILPFPFPRIRFLRWWYALLAVVATAACGCGTRNEQDTDSIASNGMHISVQRVPDRADGMVRMLAVIAHNGTSEANPLMSGAMSYDEYRQRVEILSFSQEKQWKLERNGEAIPATMAHCEDFLGTSGRLRIHLAFPADHVVDTQHDGDDQPLVLRWDDNVFRSGIHHFVINH